MIVLARFTYSPLGKALEKQTIEEQEEKQIDAINNQEKKKRLAALINKDDDPKDKYQKTFEDLVKERFDEIRELFDEINQKNLRYCFKSNTFGKRFDDFNNSIELI